MPPREYTARVLIYIPASDIATRNLFFLQYQSGFSNWTTLTISVRDEDDLPARFSSLDYTGFVAEDAAVVRNKWINICQRVSRKRYGDMETLLKINFKCFSYLPIDIANIIQRIQRVKRVR